MAAVAESTPDFVSLSAHVVSAFVSNNSVPTADLPALIATVHSALVGAATDALIRFTEELLQRVGIPLRLGEIGFDPADLDWVAQETIAAPTS